MQLKKAERKKAKIRIGIFGASGSGKTYSALLLASGMAPWEKIALIDTERSSASLYSHLGTYNVIDLEAPFTPEKYIEAMNVCQQSGMEVIIIDSIYHEWAGQGGCLEIVDKVEIKNDFTKWGKVTPRHNHFIDAILQSKTHMICCGRSKDDVHMETKNGKSVPVKVGLKAVTREGFDYEMTLCWDLDANNQAHSTKDRTSLFKGNPEFVITPDTGIRILDWIQSAPGAEVSAIEECKLISGKLKELMVTKNISMSQLSNFASAAEIQQAIEKGQIDFLIELIETLEKL